MSIRNEFEKIDPTEKQKKDIFRRIEESSKVNVVCHAKRKKWETTE